MKCPPFPLQSYIYGNNGLRKHDVGRTMVFIETGNEAFLTGSLLLKKKQYGECILAYCQKPDHGQYIIKFILTSF